MKLTRTAIITVSSFLFGALAGLATSAPIMINYAGGEGEQGVEDAIAASESFKQSLIGDYLFEDFSSENFEVGDQSHWFNTAIGQIKSKPGGDGHSCKAGDFECGKGMGIVDSSYYHFYSNGDYFWGRQPVPDVEDNPKFLDSLDSNPMQIDLFRGYNAFGFFLADPNDAGGDMTINGQSVFDTGLKNNHVYFVSVVAEDGFLDRLNIDMNNQTDGISFDGLILGNVAVPEPGTLALLGLGIGGLAAARRRQSRKTV